MNGNDPCPCGSGTAFAGCCAPFVSGLSHAPTAAALMRSRFTAYVVKNSEYLLATWHPTTRPDSIAPESIPHWTHLELIHDEENEDGRARVEFKARAFSLGQVLVLHEISRFVKENGRWYYIDGEIKDAPRTTAVKIGRNSPCPCGGKLLAWD